MIVRTKMTGALIKELTYDFKAICDVLSSFFLERHNRCTRKGARKIVPDRGLLASVVVNKTLPKVAWNLRSRGFDDE